MPFDTPHLEDFKVLVNHEEQYSLWPLKLPSPPGWSDAGKRGSKEDCLAFVRETWTDMRPLSLRRAMQGSAPARGAQPRPAHPAPFVPAAQPMNAAA